MENNIPAFIVGEQVEIINYGSMIWDGTGDVSKWIDISPELLGEIGIVYEVVITQGRCKYALKGPSKSAWYFEDQLAPYFNDLYE